MKKLTFTLFIAASFLFISKQSYAQDNKDYTFAAGLKFGGFENGISGKYFISKENSIEGLLGFRSNGVVVTGLYEFNMVAFDVPQLKFYYGFGGHIGSIGQGTYRRFNGSDRTYTHPQLLLGGDAAIGLEYIVPDSPIAISLDLNPRVEIATGPFFDLAPGLGIKYIFK
jgi:hypothetical protein